ncbi:MAG: Uma2 family endonuclease [Geitlerinemataceae cyanobacterium]
MQSTLTQWTVEDYHRMINAGILDDRRVELLAGEIHTMVPESPEHTYRGETLADRLRKSLRDRAYLREARPITLANSEPEPDIAIARGSRSDYATRHPNGSDLLLVIEISNTTLRTDLTKKRDLYASAGIHEYWVVDLQDRCFVIFREPDGTTYRQQQTVTDEPIAPIAFPDITIPLREILS